MSKEISFGKFVKVVHTTNSVEETTQNTTPAFTHFTREEIQLWQSLGQDVSAGWSPDGIPAFVTQYANLNMATGAFLNNGQPPHVNKKRVWSTSLEKCPICGDHKAVTWVNQWDLVGGLYCDACHIDIPQTSYLEQELQRKPNDSVISDSSEYLLNNPDFHNFPLFQRGNITFLGASMGTGKTTAIFDTLDRLTQNAPDSAGIVLVPRISLAQGLSTIYRKQHGFDALGLFHEGSGVDNRFIGRLGAVGCLSALPSILLQLEEQSHIDRLFIAIDEIDFSWELKRLRPEASRVIKQALSEAVANEGIVAAGQTETLFSLESFAQEIECEPDNIKAFYQNAVPTPEQANLIAYPAVPGKTNATRLWGVKESIQTHLDNGKTVYAFFSDRGDVRTFETLFESHDPVTYTSPSKGETRAKALLRNQSLTDSKLLLATSAAAVGINVLDRNAVTIICVNPRFGQRHWKEVAQEALRNRARGPVEVHYTNSPTSLPVKPSESESASHYHESLKQFQNQFPYSTERNARDFAFASLADAQPIAYLRYHLENLAGFTLIQTEASVATDQQVEAIKEVTHLAKEKERLAIQEQTANLLAENVILTEQEIRRASINTKIDKLTHLSHERLNAYCQLVGWNGEREEREPVELSEEQIEHVENLIEQYNDADTLTRQRRGWLEVHFPEIASMLFSNRKAEAEEVEAESESVVDDTMRGQILATIIEKTQGKTFTHNQLAKTIINLLTQPSAQGTTFLGRMKAGALGVHTYKNTRFLRRDSAPNLIVEWAARFLNEYYPAYFAKTPRKNEYFLEADSPAVFPVWLKYKLGLDNITTPIVAKVETERMKAIKAAKALKAQNKSQREIARQTGLTRRQVRDNTDHTSVKQRILNALADGEIHNSSDIIDTITVSKRQFNREIKILVDADKQVSKIKRGIYQLA